MVKVNLIQSKSQRSRENENVTLCKKGLNLGDKERGSNHASALNHNCLENARVCARMKFWKLYLRYLP